jgi:putative tryptophan/tyrosine transport system substrate-binding protein
VNRRRMLRFAVGVGVGGRALPLCAQNPAAGLRRVGVLAPSTRAQEEVTLKPFFEEMRKLGWIEGQTIAYDRAYADDRHQDLPRLAAELVTRKPEVIYAPPAVAAVAAKQATNMIPIVFAAVTDPVGRGLVSSLARPGGNATGFVGVAESLVPKLLELLHEMLPGAKRIGFLGDPTEPIPAGDRAKLAHAATALGLTLIEVEISSASELDAAVAKLIGQRVDAIVATSTIASNIGGRLIELANRRRLPVVGTVRMLEAGSLFSYSSSLADRLRRSAQLVDKVLKGAKPADLPVEQPTKFELVINLKAANALGIAIPQSVLSRADEVIQ